jgi:hypothetical protein
MSALESFPGWESLSQRHDLMIELYRVDQMRDQAMREARASDLAPLELARKRICEGLARLPA